MIINRGDVDGKRINIGQHIHVLDADGNEIKRARNLDTEAMTVVVDTRPRPLPPGSSVHPGPGELQTVAVASFYVDEYVFGEARAFALEHGFEVREKSLQE